MRSFYLRNLWRWACGVPEIEPSRVDIAELYRSQWSEEFERLMRNRLVMGAIRYGRLREAGKACYDRCWAIQKRIGQYARTGNKELLVDVANLALLEFCECRHPKAHFASTDDGEHVEVVG